MIRSYICCRVRGQWGLESVLDVGVLQLKCGHLFVMDIMAKTACWMLMTAAAVVLQKDDEGEDVSFQQQTPENYS